MELNLRTILVILGAVVMLGILVDGFLRMRRARQEALKLDVQGNFKFPEESFSSELPNGGARIIGERDAEELLEDAKNFRNQLDSLPVMSALEAMEVSAEQGLDADVRDSMHEERIYAGEPDFQHESYSHGEPQQRVQPNNTPADDIQEVVVPTAKPLNLDEHVPLLTDVEELGNDIAAHSINKETIAVTASEVDENIEHIELTMNDVSGIQASVADIGGLMSVDKTEECSAVQPVDIVATADVIADDNDDEDGRQHAENMMAQAAYAPVKKPGINAERLSSRQVPSLVLVTHVIPHDEDGFCGEDILYLVNSCDLRHGEKEIFHRFEQEEGEGCVQFSMANSFNPGTFDPETLLHERIHGVSLFMSLPGPEKAMNAFEAMTEMASVIARNLGGDVHDETHSIMALQTIEHNRQQVRDFVRRQKLAGKK
ncbi:MAG: cell division protein ZipA [Oleispira sp.]